MLATWVSISYPAPNQPALQQTIQNEVKPGINRRVLQVEKTVKYYTYFHRDYHKEDKCHEEFPHLRTCSNNSENGKLSSNEKRKRERTNTGISNFNPRDKTDNASFFTRLPSWEYFVAISTLFSLYLSSVLI